MARNKKKPAVKKDGASKKGNGLSLDEFSRLCDEAVAQAPKDNAANASSSKAADGLSTNPLITQQDRNPLPKALPRKSRFKNLAELKQWKLDQIAQEDKSKQQQQQQRMITYTDVDGRKYTMPAPSPDSDESSQPEERSYDQTHTDIASSGTIQRCTTFTDLNDRTVGVQTLENALQIVIPNEDPHDKTVLARPARNDELVTLTSLSEETGEEGNMVFDGVLPSLGFNGDDMAKGVGAQSGYKCAATSPLETTLAADSSASPAQDSSGSADDARALAWEKRWRSLQTLANAAEAVRNEELGSRAEFMGPGSIPCEQATHSANIDGPQAFLAETKAEVQKAQEIMLSSLLQELSMAAFPQDATIANSLGNHAPSNYTSSTAATPAADNHEAKALKAHDTGAFDAGYLSDSGGKQEEDLRSRKRHKTNHKPTASPPHVQNQINDRSSIDEDEGHEDSELSSCDCELCKLEAPRCCPKLVSLLDKAPTQVQPVAPANPRAPRPGFTAAMWANFDTLMIEASQGCDIQWFEWVMGFQTPFEAPFKAFDCDNADFLMFGPRHEREEEHTDDEEEEEQEEDEGVEAEPSSLASGCVPVDDPGVRDEVVAPLSPPQRTMEDVAPRDPPQLVTEKEKERDADDPIPPHPSEAEEEEPGPSSLAPPETAQKKKKDRKKRRKARKKAKAGPSQAGPSQAGPSQAGPSSQEQDDSYIDTLMNPEPESAEKNGVCSVLALPEPAQEVEQDTDMGLTPEACPAGEDQSEGPSAPSPAEDDSNTSTPLEPAQKIEELPDNTAADIFVDSAIGDSSSCDACSADLDPEPEKPYDKLQEEIEVRKSGEVRHDELKIEPSRPSTPNGLLTPASAINGGTRSKHEGAHVKVKSVEQLSQENQESASNINKPPSVRCQGKMLPAVLKVTESKPSTLISTAPAASTTVSLDLKESALAQGGLKTVDESGEQVEAQTANDKMPEQMQPYYSNEPLVEEPGLLPPHSIKNAPISKPETSQSQSGKELVSMASKEEQFEPTTPAVLEDFKRPTRNTANRKVEEWLQGHEAVMDSASAMPLLFEAQQSGFSEGSNDNSDEVDGSNGSLLSFGRVESLDQPEGEAQVSIPGGKNVAFANQAAALPMAEREEEEVRQRANPSPPPPKHYHLEDFDYDKLVSDLLNQPVLPRVAKRKGRALSGDGNILLVQEWRSMARRWQTISWNDEL
ncbi:hypothetical protein SLS56_000829 [Neofusicoccum ribis]|uniref:Structure-specific endonuclease subunit SLX4 n=1 Tax=Neofusicoccum ribis TaxID=45134 RepID=A0ABR3TCD8_9PEZI